MEEYYLYMNELGMFPSCIFVVKRYKPKLRSNRNQLIKYLNLKIGTFIDCNNTAQRYSLTRSSFVRELVSFANEIAIEHYCTFLNCGEMVHFVCLNDRQTIFYLRCTQKRPLLLYKADEN